MVYLWTALDPCLPVNQTAGVPSQTHINVAAAVVVLDQYQEFQLFHFINSQLSPRAQLLTHLKDKLKLTHWHVCRFLVKDNRERVQKSKSRTGCGSTHRDQFQLGGIFYDK